MHKLLFPKPTSNADGTLNKNGATTDFVIMHMEIGDHVKQIILLVTDLNKSDVFISHDWIHHHNPEIDWRKETINFIRCPLECNMELHEYHEIKPTDKELLPDDLNVHANVSTQLAIDQEKLKPKRTLNKQLPEWLKDFKDIFEPSNYLHIDLGIMLLI